MAKKASPVGGKKGCLCKDGTYNVKCCDGELQSQGIGATTEHTISNVTHTIEVRTTSNER